jgi:clan AA aspartic protease (TIGR02281 family)
MFRFGDHAFNYLFDVRGLKDVLIETDSNSFNQLKLIFNEGYLCRETYINLTNLDTNTYSFKDAPLTNNYIELPFKNGAPLVRIKYDLLHLRDLRSLSIINLVKDNDGIYEVPVVLNDVLKISFIFDSGASDACISSDVATTLIRTGTLRESDFIGTQKYEFANGDSASSKVFVLKKIQIGNKILSNVRVSIAKEINAPMLLGQSVMQRFGKFTIDNNNHTLIIE